MRRWLRVVLLSSSFLPVLFLVYAVCLAGILYIERRVGQRLPELRQYPRDIVIMAAAGYALHRVLSFHPVVNPGYCKWLATTPWSSRKPLPWPVHLVPQDVLILGIFCGMSWLMSPLFAMVTLQAFLTAYLLGLALTHVLTEEWLCGYAVAFGLGAAVWQWQEATYSLVLLLLSYLLGYLGLRRALARFPWNVAWLHTFKEKVKTGSVDSSLGWPFARLSPEAADDGWHIPLRHAVLISLLCGWWAFASIALIPDSEGRATAMVIAAMLGILLAPIVRLGTYCDGYWPPISLGGRIVTGRWLIPGYDQVFVAPLLASVVGLMLLSTCQLLGIDLLYGGPPALSASLVISLGMGPTLKEWRLTGNHRIVEGTRRNNAVKVG